MKKTTAMISIGVIALFASLAVLPATATSDSLQQMDVAIIDEQGRYSQQTFTLTTEELQQLETLLSELTEKLQQVQTKDDITTIGEDFFHKFSSPGLRAIFSMIMKAMRLENKPYRGLPKDNVFIASSGYTNKIISLREDMVDAHRFFTLWYYTATSNLLTNSKTTIVDLSPFTVKTFTGRQIGMMRNFAGVYIYQHSTLIDKGYTFFMGYAKRATGLDLSP